MTPPVQAKLTGVKGRRHPMEPRYGASGRREDHHSALDNLLAGTLQKVPLARLIETLRFLPLLMTRTPRDARLPERLRLARPQRRFGAGRW